MKKRFEIDAAIHRAETLPSWCYRDAEFFAAVQERLFVRSWQIVPEKAPADPGVVPFTLLPGLLEDPLLLARDGEGSLRCLSNVCTHRGSVLATEPMAQLRCPYHGRRFGLDGCLRSMPGFEGVEGFPSSRDDLPRLPIESLGPFDFTSMDAAASFEDTFAPVRAQLDGEFVRDSKRDRTFEIEANWLLYVENFLEGFHIPFVHPSLAQELGKGRYETELFSTANVQRAYGEGDASEVVASFFLVFPNLMFNFYPWGLSLNIVTPLAVDATRIEFQAWVKDPSKLDTGASADLDLVEAEDEAIVALVQRGVRSRFYDRGRYAVEHEACVHHFHRYLADAVQS